MKRHRFLSFVYLLLFVIVVPAQTADSSRLTVDRIFAGDEFLTDDFGGFRWRSTGSGYTRVEPNAAGGTDLVAYDIARNSREILIPGVKLKPEGSQQPLVIEDYKWSRDGQRLLIFTNTRRVWRLNTRGDYWIFDQTTGKLRKLGGDAEPATLMFAKFSPDGSRVGYVRENDIYVENLADGKITRITTGGSRTLINGTSDWVNEEEFFLRDCWRWSPDGKSLAYWQFDASGIRDFVLINNTADLYPKLTYLPYPKAGTTNAAVRTGIVSSDGGATRWIQTPGDPRQNYIAALEWTENGLFLQHLNRLQNELRLMSVNPENGAVADVLVEKDSTWVDVHTTELLWRAGGQSFFWLSERDGWRSVYEVSRDGKSSRAVTRGFDVESIEAVDDKNGALLVIASPENAAQRYLYRIAMDGSAAPVKITAATDRGWNRYDISPDARFAVHSFSAFGRVPRYEFVDLSGQTSPRVVVDNAEVQKRLDKLKKGPAEFFKVAVADGVELDGWMIRPPDFDPRKKYPVLFYVYGEPAGQTVVDRWGDTEYLWFLMLAQKGYVVASVDNRGTPAPKGRAWRKSVYRRIGVLTSSDQAEATRQLLAKYDFLDASRVGIWGWSGGGSSTLNALFRFPALYKMGMSVAPVPNMRLYDTIYQERYMGLPQENGKDYDEGSPLTFARNLKGKLLLIHGTGDDNVHYQGTEQLINELIRHDKQFRMFAYPNRSHGIYEGENTTRHLFSMLTAFVDENL